MKALLVSLALMLLSAVVPPLDQFASQSRGDAPKKQGEKKKITMIEWGPEKNGVRCAVTLCPVVWADPADTEKDDLRCADPPEKVFAGEMLHVQFVTKNVGKNPVDVICEAPYLFRFKVNVVGPDGKPAPLTSYGLTQQERGFSLGTVKIAPGKFAGSGLPLSRLFDMTREGEYKVSFSQTLNRAGEFTVTSNVLTVKVGPER
jgi:hypothetical protein